MPRRAVLVVGTLLEILYVVASVLLAREPDKFWLFAIAGGTLLAWWRWLTSVSAIEIESKGDVEVRVSTTEGKDPPAIRVKSEGKTKVTQSVVLRPMASGSSVFLLGLLAATVISGLLLPAWLR